MEAAKASFAGHVLASVAVGAPRDTRRLRAGHCAALAATDVAIFHGPGNDYIHKALASGIRWRRAVPGRETNGVCKGGPRGGNDSAGTEGPQASLMLMLMKRVHVHILVLTCGTAD